MNVCIRELTARDRESYLSMSRDFYASAAVSHDIPPEYRRRAFDVMLSGSAYMEGFMLELDGEAIGYAVVSKTWSQEAGGIAWWLEELYVLPERRDSGAGRAYFAYILDRAEKAGVARLRLEIEPDNVRAEALYKRMGFAPLGYKQMILELEK